MATLAAAAALSAATLTNAWHLNQKFGTTLANRHALVTSGSGALQLIIVQPQNSTDPYVRFVNPPNLDGRLIYALNLGRAPTLRLLQQYPNRVAYEEPPGDTGPLLRLRVVRGQLVGYQ